jgi:hypothetical protein
MYANIYVIIINFFFGGTWVELRALSLLGRGWTAWAMPPALFAFVIFQIGFCVLSEPAWTAILLIMLPVALGR